MPLLDAGERKVPEIMVHQVQEAPSDQLLVLGSLAVGLETVKAIASNYSNVCRNMQNKYKYAKICKTVANIQNMTYIRISQARSSSTPAAFLGLSFG